MLSIQNVTGGYHIHQPVIHHIDFTVKPKEIVGLIGLNGAGKSTTIKHTLGLLQPHQGEIRLNEKRLVDDTSFFRSQLGYIPESPQFYEELTLWEHLQLTALAYQLPEPIMETKAKELLTLFRMYKYKDWFPSTFSKGMKQKLMILSALLVKPAYLIIDEPFIGLDPLAIQSLLEQLEEMKQAGIGILMSTHILGMAEKYCDRYLLLHEGKIIFQGTLADFRAQAHQSDASLETLFVEMVRSQNEQSSDL